MRAATLVLALWPGPAPAGDGFEPLSGDGIRAALTGARLAYTDAWQEFRTTGRTLHNAGADSWGYWRIEGDRYCSQWPPSDLWTCYDVAREGAVIRFIGASGEVTDGVLE